MPAVTLNKGKYWVGDPKLVLPDWKPNATHVYKCGPYTFHAFKFGKNHVGAIPLDALEYSPHGAHAQGAMMTFTKDTVFYEQDGMGKLDGVELGAISYDEPALDNPIVAEAALDAVFKDRPDYFVAKNKKTKSAQADKV